jgi:hypothetical protein
VPDALERLAPWQRLIPQGLSAALDPSPHSWSTKAVEQESRQQVVAAAVGRLYLPFSWAACLLGMTDTGGTPVPQPRESQDRMKQKPQQGVRPELHAGYPKLLLAPHSAQLWQVLARFAQNLGTLASNLRARLQATERSRQMEEIDMTRIHAHPQ